MPNSSTKRGAHPTKGPQIIPVGEARTEPLENSVGMSLTVPKSQFIRLCNMRKKKGSLTEQEIIRVFIAEGLERAGF